MVTFVIVSNRVACYTVADAVKRLQRDPKTVRAWMARGRLTVIPPDDARNPLGEPLLLAEDVDAAVDGNRVLLRPESLPLPHPELESLETVEFMRRENQLLSSTVEMLQRDLVAARAELDRRRHQQRRLLEAMLSALDDESAPAVEANSR